MSAGSRYSDQQRREAVALYVLHGNWKRVSELAHIPERTLNDWSIQPWFGTMLAELRAEKASELDGIYTRILDEATQQLLDRVKNGDAVFDKGQIKRKPVSARDLALVAAITFDKRQAGRNLPIPTPETSMTVEELTRNLTAHGRWLESEREREAQQGQNSRG